PCLPGLVQLLLTGRYPERRKPPARPGPSHRRLLHGRGAAHLRPLPLPGPSARRDEGEAPRTRQASPAPGRGSLVAGGLHGCPQDPRPRTLRVGRPHRQYDPARQPGIIRRAACAITPPCSARPAYGIPSVIPCGRGWVLATLLYEDPAAGLHEDASARLREHL